MKMIDVNVEKMQVKMRTSEREIIRDIKIEKKVYEGKINLP